MTTTPRPFYPSLKRLREAIFDLQESSTLIITAQGEITKAFDECGYVYDNGTYDSIVRKINTEISKITKMIQSGHFESATKSDPHS